MAQTLINVYVIENCKIKLRHFLTPLNRYDALDKISSNDYFEWNFNINKLIKDLNLIEITTADLLQRKYDFDGNYALLTCDKDIKNSEYFIKYHRIDEDVDPSGLTLEYGTYNELYGNGATHVHISNLITQQDYTHNDGSGKLYGVINVGDLDCEVGDGILLFESREDAQAYIDNYKNGELAPYINLGMDFDAALSNYCTFIDAYTDWSFKHTNVNRVPSSKPVELMSQVIFIGTDVVY